MKPAFKCIALVARSQSRLIMLALAQRLRERFGSTIHAYCFGPEEIAFYRKRNEDGLFATISDAAVLLDRLFDPGLDERQVFAKAKRLEALTGTPINTMAITNRHLGRGYALGGFYHPRSRYSEKSSYVQMVHAFSETLEFWEREFREKGITLVINGTNEAARISRALGIPFRVLAGSRFKNLHNWATNELYENPAFERAYRRLKTDVDISMDEPYHAHKVSRALYQKRFGTIVFLRNCVLSTARYAYWNLRGYKKAKGYYYSSTLDHHHRMWRDYRKLRRLDSTLLSSLAGQRFAYFPLHIEPETALHGFSPEYFYQLALIAAVSRDLPAGILLAVKEAYGAVGRRPDNFYKQIAEFKNVVMLDTWEIGLECVKQADVIVTICGTAGMEGAVAGKPVISFGRHNIYNFLPHVRVVTDESRLPVYLREALDGAHDTERARKDGQRFLQAVVSSSFDLGTYDYVSLEQFDTWAVENALKALESSLGNATKPRTQTKVA